MYIQFNGLSSTLNKTRSCLCGTDLCIKLSKEYRIISDVRGTYCQVPSFDPEEWDTLSSKESWAAFLVAVDDEEMNKNEKQKKLKKEKKQKKQKPSSRKMNTNIRNSAGDGQDNSDNDTAALRKKSSRRIKLEEKYHKFILIRRHINPNQCNCIPLQSIALTDKRGRSRSLSRQQEQSLMKPNDQSEQLHRSKRPKNGDQEISDDNNSTADNSNNNNIICLIKYITWYHFNSCIIQKYAVNTKNNQYSFTSVKYVPTNFVKDIIKNLGYYDSD